MKKAKDKYDKHIEKLVSGNENIRNSWVRADSLFSFCNLDSGCLTMVRNGHPGPKGLTTKIRKDARLPKSSIELVDKFNAAKTKRERIAILKPFAEWQRILDEKFGEDRNDDR